MAPYIAKRALSIIPVLFVVTFIVFLIVYLIPGDPVRTILGQNASPDSFAAVRAELGLDEPFFVQYAKWLGELAHGRLGQSIVMHVPVSEVILPKLKNTLILTLGSLVFCATLGILTGWLSGLRAASKFDRIIMTITQLGANVPEFLLGILLIWVFSVRLGWLPSSGMYDMRSEGSFGSLLKHLILPAVSTGVISLSVISRLTRNAVIAEHGAEYVRTFRAFGLPRSRLLRRHVGRNVAAPVINITGLQLGYLLGGQMFVETVFSWPGIGKQLYASIVSHDYPMIQAGVLFVALSFVVVNLLSDAVADGLNPRLQR